MALSIHSPDELIAVIPHLLGFKPEESHGFLPMSSELPAARVDLPTTPAERDVVWSHIRQAYGRHALPGSSVAIVCLTADREMATDVGHEFAARFDTIGIDTRVMLWADDVRWADLDTGDMGLQTETARERIAAATVLTGRANRPPAAALSPSPWSGIASPSRRFCQRRARPPVRTRQRRKAAGRLPACGASTAMASGSTTATRPVFS